MLWIIKERKEAEVSGTTEAMMNRFAKCNETDDWTICFEEAINLNNICYKNLHIQYDLQLAPLKERKCFLCVLSNQMYHSCPPEQSHTLTRQSRTLIQKEKGQGIATSF